MADVGGVLLTVDKKTGMALWKRSLNFTIAAVYLLQNDGLLKVPFTVIGKETMDDVLQVDFFIVLLFFFIMKDESSTIYSNYGYVMKMKIFSLILKHSFHANISVVVFSIFPFFDKFFFAIYSKNYYMKMNFNAENFQIERNLYLLKSFQNFFLQII